ncbi:MAG: hypothetical protein II680_09460 [Clostridia bacterium]|nr:hypothetical protein [Clostridia bacterium]
MLDQNQDFPEKEPFVIDVRFYRRLAEKAPHSVRWYRRVMSLAPRIVCAELFCTLILLGCDFALTAFGRTTDGPIAGLIVGLVPGSMTAHLIFTLTRRAFFPLWGRAGRILGEKFLNDTLLHWHFLNSIDAMTSHVKTRSLSLLRLSYL